MTASANTPLFAGTMSILDVKLRNVGGYLRAVFAPYEPRALFSFADSGGENPMQQLDRLVVPSLVQDVHCAALWQERDLKTHLPHHGRCRTARLLPRVPAHQYVPVCVSFAFD